MKKHQKQRSASRIRRSLKRALSSRPAVAFEVTVTVESDGGYNPRFLGRTNLPSLMLLTVALESAAGEQLEEQQVTVQGGRFTTRPFAGYGVAHPPGRYVLRAIAAAPFLQPRRVRQLIGENGQLMTGPLVFEAPIGGRSVCLQQPVELEGAETV